MTYTMNATLHRTAHSRMQTRCGASAHGANTPSLPHLKQTTRMGNNRVENRQ